MTKFRRAACLWLTGIMAATFVAGNVLAFADTKDPLNSAEERFGGVNSIDVTGKVDVSGVALQNLSKSVLENAGVAVQDGGKKTVIVRLDSPSLSESVPDGETVTEYISSYAGSKKIKSINEGQTNFLNSLSSLGVSYKTVYRYSAVTNAVAIEVDGSQISAIKGITGVAGAYLSKTYSAPKTWDGEAVAAGTTENYSNVYPTGIYDSSEILEEYGVDGSGMTVAILDTGLDYTHEAFTSYMPEKLGMDKKYVAGKLADKQFNAVTLSAAKGKNITADDLYVNDKVPFAYDYADKDAEVYPAYSQHGTHVAGIIAGHADSYKDKNGNKIDSEFIGVSPNAQLVICKVFTDNYESRDLGGATTEDLVAALEDCVSLGVDIINMSLGTASGFSSGAMEGDDEGLLLDEVYDSVKKAGISLICAASNEYSSGFGSVFGTNLVTNPDSGTVGSPSTLDGAMSVASVNGLQAPFLVANADKDYATPVFYTEASDANSVKFDFAKQLLGGKTNEIFKYVVVPGIGQEADYTRTVKNLFKDDNYRTIALVSRGTTTFEAKIKTAMQYADAVIIYNNVAGTIGMSVGDIDDPIPAVSISMEAGTKLRFHGKDPIPYGYIEVNSSYLAGPFMNEYSSWGATPDLKLKPDVTAHGGEITSTVAGGYDELSGTSMASPNFAGFVALIREYVKENLSAIHQNDPLKITRLVNQITMSTATTVYDQSGLPYSPRKQGSGLATLKNAFGTGAYLWTDEQNGGAEDNRPKIELGEDENKAGKYTFSLYVSNFGAKDLDFTANSQFFTETLSADKLAVAEKAYFLNDIAPVFTINENGASSRPLAGGEKFAVKSGGYAKITVTLELSKAEKNYISSSFPNGMFVEGFITLKSQTAGQCDLNLPFMGFYGNWEDAPMLDYDAYEIAASQQDKSISESEKLQPSVWATQAYSMYYDNRYSVPMGAFAYMQDENAEQIYANTEYAAISRYDWYYGDDEPSNYLTTYAIRAVYAGLLRNAAVVTYDLSDAETGEILKRDNIYRLNKAYAGGGASTPSQVLLEFFPEELGLVNNGKYALDFYFYFNEEMYEKGERTEDNTFSMTFYVDYEAPVLVDSRVRYVDRKDSSGREWQSVYLDLDIYDNTYAQSVILCYSDKEDPEDATELKLVTDYITPVYNAKKNGTTTVSIDITNLMAQYRKYKDRLYVQIDDYALNHRVLKLDFVTSSASGLPNEFEILGGTDITLGVNETYKIGLKYEGNVNPSNFTWTTAYGEDFVKMRNGEIFGVAPTIAGMSEIITVTGANGVSKTVNVTVVDSGKKLTFPTSISFGMIENSSESLVKAAGTVKMNAGQTFALDVTCEPWYYDLSDYELKWRSSNTEIAEVSQSGEVTIKNKKGSAAVYAEIFDERGVLKCSTSVTLAVQDPFTVSNFNLTKYSGTEEIVKIPDDKNITTIAEDAFKDNKTARVVIIPSTVTTIDKEAFTGCTALEEVYFVQQDALEIPTSKLTAIMRYAFKGCTSLKKLDLSNCKTISVDRSAFEGCVNLSEIVKMENVGTMNARAFYGCVSLESADITGLHVAGEYVFGGCASLSEVKTGFFTAIGAHMFDGCHALEDIAINAKTVGASAFENCANLKTVNFGVSENGEKVSDEYIIGARAFCGCAKLGSVNFNGNKATEIGDMAFAGCTSLTSFTIPAGLVRLGDRAFDGVNPAFTAAGADYYIENGAVYCGNILLLAPKTVPAGFTLKAGTAAIGAYAFSGCSFAGGTVNLTGVTAIGEGAFANSNLSSVTIPASVTEISAYAFTGTKLTSVTIGANITVIGAGAFMDCKSLSGVTFASGLSLSEIGDAAFYGCVRLDTVTLPDGVKSMGSSVFYGCTGLISAVMPSVESLGAYTFVGCDNLSGVTFGENAKTVGDYTFGSNVITGGTVSVAGCKNLASVTLGNGTKVIGESAFMGCVSLESFDIKNINELSDGAFYGCAALKNIDLTKLEYIGNMAFYGCENISALNLESAKIIGEGAFYMGNYTTLSVPKAESVGNFAFFGGKESSVEIPLTLKELGYGAFANSPNLTEFTTPAGESAFFVTDGVLYRKIETLSGAESFELCAYPSAKIAAENGGARTYSIAEGTATVKAFAMSGLAKNAVEKVILPYSIKTVGEAAFFNSGITEYVFECINAPVLLSEFRYIGDAGSELAANSQYALFARNFDIELAYCVDSFLSVPITSHLKISYPSNGSGYGNYAYSAYFGQKAELGELMDDNTRLLKSTVESFPAASVIAGWNSLEVNKDNAEMVSGFSALVISAHEMYNILASEKQKEFFGAENEQKLFETESALKSVKARFGIASKAKSFSLSETSKHKSVYTEGEKFNIKGLVLIVTYEDYSSELADMKNVVLRSSDDKELSPLNTYVYVDGVGEYAGLSLIVPITVKEKGANSGAVGPGNGLIIGLAVGGSALGLIVIAAAVLLILKYKFKINVFGKIFKKAEKAEAADGGLTGHGDGGGNKEE